MFKNNTIKCIIITSSILMSGLTMAEKPNGSGATIWRGVNQSFIYFIDEKRDLVIAFGGDMEALCEGGNLDMDNWQTQQVNNPSDLISANILSKADDVKTYVFKYAGVGLCSDFLNYSIASGTSDLIYRNNDYFWWTSDGKNANTEGLNLHGVLENTSTGERQVLNTNYKCLAKNNDWSCETNIRLK